MATNELKQIDSRALIRLKGYRRRLTHQQYATLRGQILAGDGNAAMKGLAKIMERGRTDDGRG